MTRSSANPAPEGSRSRRGGGRPTVEEAYRLDRDVRENALHLFLDHGYDATSMDAIAAAAGTTKASLYARFPNKETVFREVLTWAIRRSDWPIEEPDPPAVDDLEFLLTDIAETSLRRALDPAMIRLGRIAITHADRFPEIARELQSIGFWPRLKVVADALRHHAARGAIVADEPEVLAELFLGMVSGVPARLASFGRVRSEVDQARHTRVAVQMFLRSLRP